MAQVRGFLELSYPSKAAFDEELILGELTAPLRAAGLARLVLVELAPGVSVADVAAATEPEITVSSDLKVEA